MTRARIIRTGLLVAAALMPALLAGEPDMDDRRQDILVIVGTPGAEEFEAGFTAAADAWREAANRAEAEFIAIGLEDSGGREDRDLLREAIESIPTEGSRPVWIAYIGHGTFDGREARLNLRGPDVTEKEIADWLDHFSRPLVFIHGGSSSGPFINALSRPGRVIITATQSGAEVNYARFGENFAHAIGDPAADIDRDEQVSVLEAFVTAADRTSRFYDEAGRLMTEHALIDDNGDRRGTPADWFRGTRVARETGDGPVDGSVAARISLIENETEQQLTAEQRALRRDLEAQLEDLKSQRAAMLESDYLRELESLFHQLAPFYLPDAGSIEDASPLLHRQPGDS